MPENNGVMPHQHRFTFYPKGRNTADGGQSVCDCGKVEPTRVTVPAEHHLAPPHLHDTEHVCRAWHLTARTPHGHLVTITSRSHPDDIALPDGWQLTPPWNTT